MCKNIQFYYIYYIYYMLPTGYNILNGGVAADLSTIFEPLPEGGTMYATPTGFIQYSTGKDLRELFAVNTSYTIPNDTNWIAQNGQDLRYIFQGIAPVPLSVTITGGTAPTPTIDGNKYTYTFTSGTRQISINKNISSFYAIVVGGGGGGGYSTSSSRGGGGGGGGFGYVSLSYVNGTSYTIVVGAAAGQATNGNSSSFKTSTTGNGVTSTGGNAGLINNATGRASSGGCTNNGTGTLVSRTGGLGGGISTNTSGGSSSGSITVLGVSYNYGGGGGSGFINGGAAGKNGIGGSSNAASGMSGEDASTPASGGGGASAVNGYSGGIGGPGRVIVIFTYP
jgi:hypothetical protein